MTKIVIASLGSKARRKVSSLSKKRVRGAGGQVKTPRTLDAGSRTFGDDLEYIFGKNVAKARRENKKTIGVADIAPKR